jgi:gliding motility-associated-like protein
MMWRWLSIVLIVGCFQPVNAQICTGSLGDPIINITFGGGPNPGAPLPGATTNYQYFGSDCPQDGYYTLRNSSVSCHGNTWHTFTDHTGDPNGYFMLVNASVYPGAFYVETVRGLCANTTYEFAAWIMNVLKSSSCGGAGIQPDLTFRLERIDGAILQTYNTNNIAASNSPQWKQYGFYFTMPANISDIVLRIINNAPGGCGNDLALDDITFRPCGPKISTAIAGETATSVSTCEATAKVYTFTSNISTGFNNAVVQWQESYNGAVWQNVAGATSTTFTKTFFQFPAGTYLYRIAAAESGNMGVSECRIVSDPLRVDVLSNPGLVTNGNKQVCEGSNITLTTSTATANWMGPMGYTGIGSTITITQIQQSQAGRYFVTTINGTCSRRDSVDISVNPTPKININTTKVGLCEGDTVELLISGADTYSWQPNQSMSYSPFSGLSIYPIDSTIYLLKGSNNVGCTDSLQLTVNVFRRPVANAGGDISILEGATTQLSGSAKGDSIFYTWTPVYNLLVPQSLTPVIDPIVDTSYILHVSSYLNCKADADTVAVHVFKKVVVPNAFSPNKDGINDDWRIQGIEAYPGAEVTVFNRFGQLVFRSSSFLKWDGTMNGKPLPVGVYYYLINLRNKFPAITGWLLLMQ